MFWQETSFPENRRQTALQYAFISFTGREGPGRALTLVGQKQAGPQNFRQKMGQVVIFRPVQGSSATVLSKANGIFKPLSPDKVHFCMFSIVMSINVD